MVDVLKPALAAAALLILGSGLPIVPVAGTMAAVAQEAAPDPAQVARGKRIWAGRGGCTNCHGWAGNGEAREPYPPGANLRETALDATQLAEAIKCGRPATGMPHFDKAAYTDDRCFGLTAEDLGNDKPPLGTSLRTADFEALAAYIVAEMKGRSEITKAECEAYFGAGDASCTQYQ